jgi:glyoxylase-like metal-dependent hydrolase (beta-lactamase superfamily II)
MTLRLFSVTAAISLAAVVSAQDAGPLTASAAALGVANIRTIVYSGFGSSYFVGQNPTPAAAWPRVSLNAYTAEIDYDQAAMRVDMRREQGPIQPRGGGPAFAGERREIQAVSGTLAWNIPFGAPPAGRGRRGAGPPSDAAADPPGRGRGAAAVAQTPQPAFADASLRALQIWMTPHGFLKAAAANHATTRRVAGGVEVSFVLDGRSRFTGLINSRSEVERVSTWVASPVLGDMPVETEYHDYVKSADGVLFPMHITERQGGHPALDLYVTRVESNVPVEAAIPDSLRDATPAPTHVDVQKIADGVYVLRGGTHHSVIVEMSDHLVLVEAPVDEARSAAILGSVASGALPNKPIRFVINTHHHFDHAGGLRALADAGATVVTYERNRAFYEAAWRKAAKFQTFTDKAVLTDGSRTIEVRTLQDSPHAEGLAVVYLPSEKLLVEADAYTAPAAAAAAPPPPGPPGFSFGPAISPSARNLYDNIVRLKLDVAQIVPLHGQGLVKMSDFTRAVGR